MKRGSSALPQLGIEEALDAAGFGAFQVTCAASAPRKSAR